MQMEQNPLHAVELRETIPCQYWLGKYKSMSMGIHELGKVVKKKTLWYITAYHYLVVVQRQINKGKQCKVVNFAFR